MLTYDAVWPFFLCLAVLMLVSATPVFRAADMPPGGNGHRQSNLDGLRGFLAMSVFFQHAAIYHHLLAEGVWIDPPRFYFVLGQVGVSLFFMITGYLFWGKLLAEAGRPAWLRLYLGRVFRIAPVYLFAVAAVLVIVFAKSDFRLVQPLGAVLRQIGAWMLIGSNGGGPDVNGYRGTGMLLFGVTWTLSSEWKFYASLPLWSIIASRPKMHVPALVLAGTACLAYSVLHPQTHTAAPGIRALLFVAGMTAATLEKRGLLLTLPHTLLSASAAGVMGMLLAFANTAYAIVPVLGMSFAFYLIICGANLFGVLTTRPARRMGDVSYSIYLLQGLVTTMLFRIPWMRALALHSPLSNWSAMCGCAVLLLLVSLATYHFIERPGIALGKRVAEWLRLPPRKQILQLAPESS